MSKGKYLEFGKGHSMNDSAFVEIGKDEDGQPIHTERTYDVIERPETDEEMAVRQAHHAEFEKTMYRGQRQAEMPDFGEACDALASFFESLPFETYNALPEKARAWHDARKAVKAKYPKPL